MSVPEAPWFKDGLRFECVSGCTRCCRGEPGDVFVTREELAAIAKLLGEEPAAFEDRCVRHYSSGKLSLKERKNGDCVLLNATGCTAYAARPRQCRDFPFWPEVVESPASWLRESRRCPGIDSGPLHDAAFICQTLLRQQAGE